MIRTAPSLALLVAAASAVSVADAGEYCRTLLTVVAISLLTSWLISMTITPLQCIDMLPEPKKESTAHKIFRQFTDILVVILILAALVSVMLGIFFIVDFL